MRLAASLLAPALLALAACEGELALEVVVTHPAEAGVASTVVSIYESNTTTCKQIELGDLSTAELAAILVAEQTIGATTSGSLDGISRVERKLVVARGYDAMDRLLTAGCAEKEEITGRDVVPVDTVFAATLSIGALEPGGALPITLTDAEGRPLAGHPVTWRAYGPDGATAAATGAALAPAEDAGWELAAPACTSGSGVAQLHPVPPSTVGGFAIAIRPSWPSQPSPLLTRFTRIDPTLTDAIPAPDVTRPCAIRVAGTARQLVCLQLAAPGGDTIARAYEVTVQSGNGRLEPRDEAPVDARAVALFSVERSAAVRDVYAITSDGRVIGVLGPSVAPDPSPHPPPAGQITDAVLMPACEAGQAAQLVVRADALAGRRLFTMPPLGGPLADYHGVGTSEAALRLTVRGAGCVTELAQESGGSPRRRQATVVEISQRVQQGERATLSVVLECDLPDRTRCRVGLPVAAGGAALSRPGDLEEPRLTGVFLDASGVVMSAWVLLPTPEGELLLVERERFPSAALPNLVVSGRFDADARTDLFWDLPNPLQQASNLQVTYGRRIGAQRLTAVSGAEPILVDDLLAGDLTGDGVDDVVLAGRQRRGGMTASGVIVIPMNVPIPNADTGFDRPCE